MKRPTNETHAGHDAGYMVNIAMIFPLSLTLKLPSHGAAAGRLIVKMLLQHEPVELY